MSISPLRMVILISGSRWSRVVSYPAKPPYKPTPLLMVNLAKRSVVSVVGLCTPCITQISCPATAPVSAYCKVQASAQLEQSPLHRQTVHSHRPYSRLRSQTDLQKNQPLRPPRQCFLAMPRSKLDVSAYHLRPRRQIRCHQDYTPKWALLTKIAPELPRVHQPMRGFCLPS